MICSPSKDSDQPGHPPGLIRVFTVRSLGSYGPELSSYRQRGLIRLGGYPGWSESLLGHMPFCWSLGAVWSGSALFAQTCLSENFAAHLSHVMRKPVFWGFRPGRTQTWRSIGITLSRQWTTKALIRLCGCAGWPAPLLFAYSLGFLMTWPICGRHFTKQAILKIFYVSQLILS